MPASAHSPSEGWRIIVTDDTPDKLYALSKTLRQAGHCVFAAYDGQSALELVELLPDIDLLITNTRLGLIDGPELMQYTRKLKPDLPILHVAHAVAHPGAPDGDTPPGVPTLREPFTPNQLLMVIGSLLA
jgi:CheY-like chemotaxis protein